jgi:twitching motility two-component system response regulator PilH
VRKRLPSLVSPLTPKGHSLARKILLADDSVTAQNMGRRILADAGYEVITVNNGSAALKKITELKPDLIVLDVYMPGYSGLEVCQRIKETRETARIPVLLTVGKLEPFKPDEAKRARADAFIVKPFEASELLTALTKLEDRIVPEARRPKGRFAKALTEADDEERFGDKEGGWKNRLSLPAPGAKAEAAEEPTVAAPAAASRQDEGEVFRPSASRERSESVTRVVLPADVSAEEIAAIQAAAAKVAHPEDESNVDPRPDAVITTNAVATTQETTSEAAPATLAPAAEKSSEWVTPSEMAASQATGREATSSSPSSIEADATRELSSDEKPAPPDQDVMAAIASLAPSNGEGATTSATILTGPRWVAEPAALSSDDSTYVLEHEMEKTYAAIAAAEAGRAAVLAAAAETTSSLPVHAIASAATPEPTQEKGEEAAYAAAASLSGTAPQAISETRLARAAPEMDEGEKHREAELAAAWQNWKQIRESIVESEITAHIAEAAAAELKAGDQPLSSVTGSDEQSVEVPVSEPSGESKTESAAIASIVDSVLAELKPRLVEEIARKMSRERKK